MKASEFVRRVKRLAQVRGVPFRFEARKGKGSHGRLYYGSRFTTVKDRKQEVGVGLLNAMLSQLGLTRQDLDL
jgi:mRNA interferase HicA